MGCEVGRWTIVGLALMMAAGLMCCFPPCSPVLPAPVYMCYVCIRIRPAGLCIVVSRLTRLWVWLLSNGDIDRRTIAVADHRDSGRRARVEGRQSSSDGDIGLPLDMGLSGFVVVLYSVRPF